MPAKPPVPESETATLKSVANDNRLVPMFNYLLVFLMVMTMGLSGILALLVANFREDKAADWIKTHYEFQKRTFWIGILPTLLVCGALIRLHITNQQTILLMLAIPMAYTAGRAVLGFNHLFNERAVPNPKAWIA